MALDQRPRGILSEADRRYLMNPDEYSKQAGYERRQAIIQRIHEGLHDFPLLVSKLDEDSRAKAFEDGDLETKDHTINVLSSAFTFLYLGITDTVEPSDLAKDGFEDIVADGIKQAYLQRGDSVRNVTVDIEVETGPPLEEILDQDELGFIEIMQLIEAGELPAEEATELLNELLQEHGDEPVDEEGKFQGAAARFPADVLDPIFSQTEDDSAEEGEEEIYDPTQEFED